MRGFPKLILVFFFACPALMGMKHIENPLEIGQSIRAHKNPSIQTIKFSIQEAAREKKYKNRKSLLIITKYLSKKHQAAYKKIIHEENEFDRNPFLGGAFTTEQDYRDLRAPIERAKRQHEEVCDVQEKLRVFIWTCTEHEKKKIACPKKIRTSYKKN